jgi:hypothetical protein
MKKMSMERRPFKKLGKTGRIFPWHCVQPISLLEVKPTQTRETVTIFQPAIPVAKAEERDSFVEKYLAWGKGH